MQRLLIALAALLATGAAAAADTDLTLDQVLDRYTEARGGRASWEAVDSAKMDGTMLMGPGIEAPFRIWFKRPNKVRMEFDVQGMTGVQAFDGEAGWYVMPFMGKTEPEPMAEDQLKDIVDTADFDGPLIGWQEKGHQLTLAGVEEVDGTEAYRIDVVKANGDEMTVYLDAEYFLEFKQTARTSRQGNEVVVHTEIGDYKEVGDIVLPHSMEMTFEGMPVSQAISIETIELNPGIDDDRFAMPEGEAAATDAE